MASKGADGVNWVGGRSLRSESGGKSDVHAPSLQGEEKGPRRVSQLIHPCGSACSLLVVTKPEVPATRLLSPRSLVTPLLQFGGSAGFLHQGVKQCPCVCAQSLSLRCHCKVGREPSRILSQNGPSRGPQDAHLGGALSAQMMWTHCLDINGGAPTPMCWGPPGPQCHPVSEGAPEQAAGTLHGTFCRRVMSHGPWVVWFYSQEGTHGVCSV